MPSDTSDRLLDAAERLTQTRGFNGFSYRDLEQAIGIKTASIHYHFPTKSDLGVAMADRYVARFALGLAEINTAHPKATDRLCSLVDLFQSVIDDKRFCVPHACDQLCRLA